jgi:ribosomal protein L7/L12
MSSDTWMGLPVPLAAGLLLALGLVAAWVTVRRARGEGVRVEDASAPGASPRVPAQALSPEALLAEVLRLKAQGRLIEAIKRVREARRLSLAEAKALVERLPADASAWPEGALPAPPAAPAATEEGLARVRALAAAGEKIEAIKEYRRLTGVGLKEAKDHVESL